MSSAVARRSAFVEAGGFHPRFFIGGEEELLATDLASAGWHMAYVPVVVVHHEASTLRDPHLRRRHGVRNTLGFTWLRRPLGSALRRTLHTLRTLPRDRVSVAGVLDALAGLPWLLRQRRVVPGPVDRRICLLDAQRLTSSARRHVS